MVRVPSGTLPQTSISGFGSLGPYPIEHYFIDRCEVTSKQYQAFVDGGGYQKREYWKNEFVKDGRVLSWEEAMAGFRDATGRPGPATWEAGRYPAGRDNFPVAGVSWYEAAAYAEFAGKSLPTIYHWLWAAGLAASPYIVPLSNFGTDGPAAVASYKGIGPFGTYDMAGNVKEWCWNETKGLRFILGGAWDEATYMFSNADARSPFDRSATNGFRCASYPTAIPDRLTGPRQREFRDYGKERPASDELFRVFARQYAYDRRELNAVLVSVDESQESWRKQKIAFDAAYGGERVTAYLFLPKNLRPPYQTVVFFPGSGVLLAESSEHLVGMNLLDYIIKSGRAVLYPVYQETYERRPKSWEPAMGTTAGRSLVHRRDRIVMWYKDLARSIDYLETRADVDRAKLAFLGHSMGAADGPIFCALEPRLKVCILQVGGLYQRETLPEVDAFHFAPRVKVPTLMLNGREDFIFPLESSQLPLYRLLGTPAEHKRHVVLEAAHDLGAQRTRVVREVLDWLDRYLGPIR
jgi:cephalosporin-C deacetylase-like acetyl esterase